MSTSFGINVERSGRRRQPLTSSSSASTARKTHAPDTSLELKSLRLVNEERLREQTVQPPQHSEGLRCPFEGETNWYAQVT